MNFLLNFAASAPNKTPSPYANGWVLAGYALLIMTAIAVIFVLGYWLFSRQKRKHVDFIYSESAAKFKEEIIFANKRRIFTYFLVDQLLLNVDRYVINYNEQTTNKEYSFYQKKIESLLLQLKNSSDLIQINAKQDFKDEMYPVFNLIFNQNPAMWFNSKNFFILNLVRNKTEAYKTEYPEIYKQSLEFFEW